jgi:outer membrane lipoprotein-sorting protein
MDPSSEDDRWAYLPALRKVRRIAGGDRGQSFFGTDLSYEDLAERNATEDTHRYVRTEALNGRTHYVIESTPRDASFPYSKRILWVDPATSTVSKIKYFDAQGRQEKVLLLEWQQADSVWAWKRLDMQTLRTGHRTIVEVDQVQHGVGLADALFSESALQLGAHP